MNWSDVLVDMQMRLGAPEELRWLVQGITYALVATVIASLSLALALVLIWITRKVVSRIQDRIGPNRQGPYGLFQTVADALKLMSKEDITPANAGEEILQLQVRFRTVGDITCTAPVLSDADTVEKIVIETATTTITERGATRLDDQTSDASMEQRKKEGYF